MMGEEARDGQSRYVKGGGGEEELEAPCVNKWNGCVTGDVIGDGSHHIRLISRGKKFALPPLSLCVQAFGECHYLE